MENPMESSTCQAGNVSDELSCFETLEGADKLLGNSDFDQWSQYSTSTSFYNYCTWPDWAFLNLEFLQITMESTYLGPQLAELFENSESADVALHCAGQVIKAHSAILAMRSIPMKMLG